MNEAPRCFFASPSWFARNEQACGECENNRAPPVNHRLGFELNDFRSHQVLRVHALVTNEMIITLAISYRNASVRKGLYDESSSCV
jgi:hypothetical protein